MWTATRRLGLDLSKTFSKNSLEIVLDTKFLAPYIFSDFWKDKTPKALDNQVESICKLACKGAHADCSASLCLWQRSAKRHLEKGDARGEYFTGFSAFSTVWYFRLFCGNVGFVKKSWKPFGRKSTGVRIPQPAPSALEHIAPRLFLCASVHPVAAFGV